MKNNFRSIIQYFLDYDVKKTKILVIGDVMLDRYFYGNVTRISPEAPVPVNCIEKEKNTLGGAANVANNLSSLGCNVCLAGMIGDDYHGRLLTRAIEKSGISTEGIFIGQQPTITKVRVLSGHQQMLRLDFEKIDKISAKMTYELKNYIKHHIVEGVKAVIISDYGKGVCNDEICQFAIRESNLRNIPVFVDPKGQNWDKYNGASYVTPNVKEVGVVVGKKIVNQTEILRQAVHNIKSKYKISSILVTRSENGLSMFGDKEVNIPTVAREVFDVSGAGDTVISSFVAALSGGLNEEVALNFANFAAGLEVGKVGTYAVSKEDILKALKCNE